MKGSSGGPQPWPFVLAMAADIWLPSFGFAGGVSSPPARPRGRPGPTQGGSPWGADALKGTLHCLFIFSLRFIALRGIFICCKTDTSTLCGGKGVGAPSSFVGTVASGSRGSGFRRLLFMNGAEFLRGGGGGLWEFRAPLLLLLLSLLSSRFETPSDTWGRGAHAERRLLGTRTHGAEESARGAN